MVGMAVGGELPEVAGPAEPRECGMWRDQVQTRYVATPADSGICGIQCQQNFLQHLLRKLKMFRRGTKGEHQPTPAAPGRRPLLTPFKAKHISSCSHDADFVLRTFVRFVARQLLPQPDHLLANKGIALRIEIGPSQNCLGNLLLGRGVVPVWPMHGERSGGTRSATPSQRMLTQPPQQTLQLSGTGKCHTGCHSLNAFATHRFRRFPGGFHFAHNGEPHV